MKTTIPAWALKVNGKFSLHEIYGTRKEARSSKYYYEDILDEKDVKVKKVLVTVAEVE